MPRAGGPWEGCVVAGVHLVLGFMSVNEPLSSPSSLSGTLALF